MIRFLLVASFVVLFLIFSIPLLIFEWILGSFLPEVKNRTSLAIVNWGFKQCLKISGVTVTVIGEENVPKDKAVLYVGNHRSYFDILLTYVRVPGPTGFIAKKEIEKVPLLRNWMRNLHCLFLDRDNIKEGLKTILEGIEKLKSGISIFVFPEGTRSKEKDAFLPIHKGSFKLAEKSGAPIIPVALVNTSAIFEDQCPRIKKTHVVIEYGRPIDISELDPETKKNLAAYVFDQIKTMYFKNKELL